MVAVRQTTFITSRAISSHGDIIVIAQESRTLSYSKYDTILFDHDRASLQLRLLRHDRRLLAMLISSDTCKVLARIVLAGSNDEASARGPFTVRDRRDNWMVVGPAIEGEDPSIVRRIFYMFIRKIGAEVTGIGYCLDFTTDEEVEAAWRQHATPSQIGAWDQRPEVEPSPVTLDLYGTLHGGLINRPEFAVAYAEAILDLPPADRQEFEAVEKQGVWHILAANKTVFAFARRDGKIVASP